MKKLFLISAIIGLSFTAMADQIVDAGNGFGDPKAAEKAQFINDHKLDPIAEKACDSFLYPQPHLAFECRYTLALNNKITAAHIYEAFRASIVMVQGRGQVDQIRAIAELDKLKNLNK
jgi:hypothetical protein